MKKIISAFALLAFLAGGVNLAEAKPFVVVKKELPKRVLLIVNKPKCPYKHGVWIAGHWRWQNSQFVWAEGYWVKHRPGFTWVDGHWGKSHEGWIWIEGHWRKL